MNPKDYIGLAAALVILIVTGWCDQGGSVLRYLLAVSAIAGVAWLAAQYIDYRAAEAIRAERMERLKQERERA